MSVETLRREVKHMVNQNYAPEKRDLTFLVNFMAEWTLKTQVPAREILCYQSNEPFKIEIPHLKQLQRNEIGLNIEFCA